MRKAREDGRPLRWDDGRKMTDDGGRKTDNRGTKDDRCARKRDEYKQTTEHGRIEDQKVRR